MKADHVSLQHAVEEITGARFRDRGVFHPSPDFKSGDPNGDGNIWIEFRIDGRAINFGQIARLQRRLATEDISVEVCIDTTHVRADGDYSDPGPDDHIKYTITNARWRE